MTIYRDNEIVHAHGVRFGEELDPVCQGGPIPVLAMHWEGVNCQQCLAKEVAKDIAGAFGDGDEVRPSTNAASAMPMPSFTDYDE